MSQTSCCCYKTPSQKASWEGHSLSQSEVKGTHSRDLEAGIEIETVKEWHLWPALYGLLSSLSCNTQVVPCCGTAHSELANGPVVGKGAFSPSEVPSSQMTPASVKLTKEREREKGKV